MASRSTNMSVRVFDEDGNDVTPRPLYQPEPGKSKSGRCFLDELVARKGSDMWDFTSTFHVASNSSFMGSSRPPLPSPMASQSRGTEDSLSKLKTPANLAAPSEVPKKRDNVKEDVSKEMQETELDIYLTETDTITLFSMPSRVVSEDADNAEDIKKRNLRYAAVCESRLGNDNYKDRASQTLGGALKVKQIQTEEIVMVDEGTYASVSDIYDSFCDSNETSESQKTAGYPERMLDAAPSLDSQLEMEMYGNSESIESQRERIMSSESIRHNLILMQRCMVADAFQPKMAAYKQLPILTEDPDSTVKAEEQDSSSPTLEELWTFNCDLTRGCTISCMAWNKINQNILAVAYDDCDDKDQKPGLVCGWCFKNPTWPERLIHCDSYVTSLDFSTRNPSWLAVGMTDGTIGVYDFQYLDPKSISSRACSTKHLFPVWQVVWAKQGLTSEDRREALISASEDSRISKWFFCSKGLDCTDLMELKNIKNLKKKAKGKWRAQSFSSAPKAPARCVAFSPTVWTIIIVERFGADMTKSDEVTSTSCFMANHAIQMTNAGDYITSLVEDPSIYLAGTGDGPIHKCSVFEKNGYLDTYKEHFYIVHHIQWSPFCPDVFLSCSSDWTIQLWRQDHRIPILSFPSSSPSGVRSVRWSPIRSTVFAAVNGKQVEIWDLNSSLLVPVIVHDAAPGVKVTSLLLSSTDCVLVGDSVGQVTVYRMKNLKMGKGLQVDMLEDAICAAMSMFTFRNKLQSQE